MSTDKEVIELCKIVLENVGIKRIANRIGEYLENPSSKTKLQELYDEALNWDGFNENFKKRNIVLGNNLSILKFFIITFQKDFDENGEPVIIINKLEDETASFKDNPIKNLYIIYKNEEDRDIDYERLLLMK
nr:MAG TPA: hypothetical protein [Caudoviricetes sp.]